MTSKQDFLTRVAPVKFLTTSFPVINRNPYVHSANRFVQAPVLVLSAMGGFHFFVILRLDSFLSCSHFFTGLVSFVAGAGGVWSCLGWLGAFSSYDTL